MKLRLFETAIALIFLASSAVGAATLTVTTPNPAIAANGQCSLIEAIINANDDAQTHVDCPAGSGADTIVLSGITYTFTESYDGVNGLPIITSPITIEGNNATIARDISSDEAFRLFEVAGKWLGDEVDGDLTLYHTTITGGYVQGLNGGGIHGRGGPLTLVHSTVTGNTSLEEEVGYQSDGGFGGGIDGANITMINSTIANNTSDNEGGGIAGDGTIINSTISDNSNHTADGSGISWDGTIINSTISDNTGGVGCQIGSFGLITNSTISGNTGGGIVGKEYDIFRLINSTVAGNGGRGLWGISPDHTDPRMFIINTILANNEGEDCETDVTPFMIGSLVGDGSCSWVYPPGSENIVGDPMLGPLQNNGGPTETHALLAGSPAIDGGTEVCLDADGEPLTTDQRGEPRPVDGNGDGVTACDIGAFELQPDVLTVDIDIKPRNKKNAINPRAKGGVWVAILSDTGSPFDPSSQVDIPTVEFGPDGAKANRHKVKDVNKDGLGDLLLRFKIPETGIACGDTEATLTGETFDDEGFIGTDYIKTVGCKKPKNSKTKKRQGK